jgi:hypothetical protein
VGEQDQERRITMNAKQTTPMELAIGNQRMRFTSVEEFEFSLNGRTSIPARKMSELMKLAPRELKAEAVTIEELEKRFQTLLERAEDTTISNAMMRLDPTIFSKDNDWRSIIAGLNECGEGAREYKLAALKKYLQYLRSRKAVLMDLYRQKQVHADQEVKDHTIFSSVDKLSATANLESTMSGPTSDVTQMFQQVRKKEPVTRRLSKGEPVIIHIKSGENVEISLSKHKFWLTATEGLELIDEEGQHYMLAKGRNLIGRDMECDISLSPVLKDISRKHLIIENLGDNRLKLTDLSSHGTTVTQ